ADAAPLRAGELRGGEADVHVARVGEDAVVVAAAIALVGAAGAAGGADRLHRVRLQQPVRDVDDVDVLLDDDVAGERDVVDPVAQATRRGRRVGPLGPLDRRSEVVDLARDGRPDLAGMHAPGELDVWRGVADLEAYREAQLPRARLLPERHHRLRAGHVDGDRLLEVDVLAGADGGLEVR